MNSRERRKAARKLTARKSFARKIVVVSAILLAVAVGLAFVVKRNADCSQREFIAAIAKHCDQSGDCQPVRIERREANGNWAKGRGVMVSFKDGWQFIWTVAHVFGEDFGGRASYEVLLNGQRSCWITGFVTPREFSSKLATDFAPDVVICEVGPERVKIDPIKVARPVIHDRGFLVKPFVLRPIEAGMKSMTVTEVADWQSKFPVFLAQEIYGPGGSGAGYLDEKGTLFLMSGGRGFTLFVSANPIGPLKPPGSK